MLAEAGAAEVTPGAADEFWERTGAEPALDVNMLASGEPRTVIPSVARAQVSLRLAPGQSADEMAAELERLLRAAAPEGAEVSLDLDLADPALFDPREPALQLAAGAFERACGTPPAFVRLGGTLPLLAVLAEQGTPTIVSGFALGADAFHAPNESYRLESLRLGELTARELYRSLADLRGAKARSSAADKTKRGPCQAPSEGGRRATAVARRPLGAAFPPARRQRARADLAPRRGRVVPVRLAAGVRAHGRAARHADRQPGPGAGPPRGRRARDGRAPRVDARSGSPDGRVPAARRGRRLVPRRDDLRGRRRRRGAVGHPPPRRGRRGASDRRRDRSRHRPSHSLLAPRPPGVGSASRPGRAPGP